MAISPLAPDSFPDLPPLEGVRLAALHAGIRYKTRKDLLLVELAAGTTVAGVFTRSKTAAAPVLCCCEHLKGGKARGLLVNSGNANAFTGAAGEKAVVHTVGKAAELIGCTVEEMFVASTGVIGEPLPDERIISHLQPAYDSLSADDWEGAARAIMTTDTFPKMVTRKAYIGETEVTINGIAKGSGMIAPDMATMLAFIFTDANIPAPVLQELLTHGNEKSFNAITVDSDTSTSDTVLLFATAQARHAAIGAVDDPLLDDFRENLDKVMLELAHLIVRDGEGASKFVTVEVTGSESDVAAKRIGLAIANSPLVKTAIAGEDPNWGRIVMAVGKSGEAADRDKLSIWIGDSHVAADGAVCPDYSEKKTAEYMKGQEITLRVDVGVGQGKFTVWSCDLTHEYISINADYRS